MRNSFVHVQPLSVSSVSIFGVYNLWDGSFGRSWGICRSPVSLFLSLPLQCSVESVKQLVPPLPPRLLSRTHTHTHARTLAPAPLRWEFALTPGSVWPQGTRVAGQTSTQLTCGTYHPRSSPEGGGGGGAGPGGGAGSGLGGEATGGRGRGHLIRATGKAKQLQPSSSASRGRCSQLGSGRGRPGCGAAGASSPRKCDSLHPSVMTV